MKRVVWIAAIVLLGFVLGWLAACVVIQRQATERLATLENEWKDRWTKEAKSLRQEIYGPNYFHDPETFPEIQAKLTAYTPSGSEEVMTLSYVGGLGGSDTHLGLNGNGELWVDRHGERQLITTLSRERCEAFFRRILTSGILNYSEGVVELKRDLLAPEVGHGVTCSPTTGIRISIPGLEVEKEISIYTPQVELENYPDIVEYQLIAQFENELIALVPKDFPLWER